MDLDEPDRFAAEAVGPIVFVVWRGTVTAEATERVAALLHRTAAAHPQGIGFVTIAQFRAPIPNASVRARIVEVYDALGSTLKGVAQVVEGTGFWASAALGFIAGLGLLHRHSHAMKVFGRHDQAAAWIAGLGLPQAPSVSALRARIDARTIALDAASSDATGRSSRCAGDGRRVRSW